jgi:hypothetical protein
MFPPTSLSLFNFDGVNYRTCFGPFNPIKANDFVSGEFLDSFPFKLFLFGLERDDRISSLCIPL